MGRIDYERMRTMPYDPGLLGLARIQRLLDRLGNPQQGLRIIHVAGTKGKGSTAAMIAAILTAAGYRTGLFSSPHLDRIEQRMAINGQACPPEEFVKLVGLVRPAVEALDREAAADAQHGLGPTYFEITTAMALMYFARAKAHAAVLEVGLGGRLDATNVCRPLVSVITSISFDHTRQLGNTLAAIAAEKAGIVKPGVPVVSGVVAEEPRAVIRQACRQHGCRLLEQGVDFDFDYQPPRHLEQAATQGRLTFRGLRGDCPNFRLSENGTGYPLGAFGYRDLALSLVGRHQAANATLALAVVGQLQQGDCPDFRLSENGTVPFAGAFAGAKANSGTESTRGPQQGIWQIPDEAVRRGLAEVVWPARIEVVARRPAVVLDVAHNVASVEALAEVLLESFCVRRRLLVFATTAEKDHRGMLRRLLPLFDEVLLTRYLSNPRAVPAEELAAVAAELTGRSFPVFPEPAAAWAAVRRMAGPEDLICITGSFFIAAEIKREILL
jgi:dihydrofolate synthase/folylpolyglutamate synthase